MKTPEFVDWLRDNNLGPVIRRYYQHFKPVLMNCLDIKANERLIIIGDLGSQGRRIPALMMGCYLLAAKELGIKFDVTVQQPKNKNEAADEYVIERLLNSGEGNVIALCTSGKVGSMSAIGKSFRRFIKDHNHRFVSTPSLWYLESFKFPYIVRALGVDYAKMKKKGEMLKEMFDSAKEIHVTTRKGTDLRYGIEGMNSISNVGLYHKPGSGGNIPAGEVYTPCSGKNVNGKVVIDGSVRTRDRTILINKPVTLHIKEGEITKIEGDEAGKALEESLVWASNNAKYPWGIRRVAELGIGINHGAKLVGPTIINEKALGTAHIGIGSNAWFGGTIYAINHYDQVFTEPIIRVDGKLLNGELSR